MGPSSDGPVALFIGYHTLFPKSSDAPPMTWMPREVGFRSFGVPWGSVAIEGNETRISGGFEVLADGERRPLSYQETITPQLIFHRVEMKPPQDKVLSKLAQANPDALISFHPELQYVGTKWGAELCFREAEKLGIRVARPETFLVEKQEMAEKLKEVGESYPLIFKPAEGSMGRGIHFSDSGTFDSVVQDVIKSDPDRFVSQKLIVNPISLDGRKLDLRLYALVSSFRPLRFEVYREGIVKIAAKPSDPDGSLDPLSLLTNCSFRASQGMEVENLTMSQLLDELQSRGYRVDNFWQRIDALAESVFESYAQWEPLATSPDLSRLVLLTGIDILLVESEDGIEPLFIESNHTPLLYNFGPDAVEEGLLRTIRLWLTSLYEMCNARSDETQGSEHKGLPQTAPKNRVISFTF